MSISVCMATYNGAKFIKQQVDSILQQIGAEDELVISDDGSTDKTIEILESFQDSRIKLFRNIRNKIGLKPVELATTNFEKALSHATGDVIFLADQDDIWLPNKVKVCMNYLRDYDIIMHNFEIVNENLEHIGFPKIGREYEFSLWKSLFSTCPFHGCCLVFKKAVLKKALPFPKNLQSHDRWIGWIGCFKFKYKIITPEILLRYRRYGGNISGSSKLTRWQRMNIRLSYCKFLILRLLFNKNKL